MWTDISNIKARKNGSFLKGVWRGRDCVHERRSERSGRGCNCENACAATHRVSLADVAASSCRLRNRMLRQSNLSCTVVFLKLCAQNCNEGCQCFPVKMAFYLLCSLVLLAPNIPAGSLHAKYLKMQMHQIRCYSLYILCTWLYFSINCNCEEWKHHHILCYSKQETNVVTQCEYSPDAFCRETRDDECHDLLLRDYLAQFSFSVIACGGPASFCAASWSVPEQGTVSPSDLWPLYCGAIKSLTSALLPSPSRKFCNRNN